jgi:hypothetical protein
MDELPFRQTENLYDVLAPVRACEDQVVMDIKRVSTNLRTKDGVYDTTCAHVIDLDGAIPASRKNEVLVSRVELDCEDSVCMARVVARPLLHNVHSLLGLLIVDVKLRIRSSCGEYAAIMSKVKSVNVVTILFVEGVRALARKHMPMINHSVRGGGNQHS